MASTRDLFAVARTQRARGRAISLIAVLAEGKSVALVSDAGTPAISDPGAIAVAHVREAGFRVVPVPGAERDSCRRSRLRESGRCRSASMAFSRPQRRARESAAGTEVAARHAGVLRGAAPDRGIRGKHRGGVWGRAPRSDRAGTHQVVRADPRLQACDAAALAAAERRTIGAANSCCWWKVAARACNGQDDSQRVLEILLRELPLKQAVKLAAEITGARKNALYDRRAGTERSEDDSKATSPENQPLKSCRLTITKPDDWHLHLRDGDAMKAVLPDTARALPAPSSCRI